MGSRRGPARFRHGECTRRAVIRPWGNTPCAAGWPGRRWPLGASGAPSKTGGKGCSRGSNLLSDGG